MKVGASETTWYWLFKETVSKLDSFAALVKENKSLYEAADFCRYVINSRLCDLLDEHPGTTNLPCDGRVVYAKASKLLKAVQRRWETRDERPHVEQAELVQIRADLAELRLRITGSSAPHLSVMEGASE